MGETEAPIQLYRVHPEALSPMAADRAALGMVPVNAFQYCEAMRVASSFGWYVFPPQSVSLMFDGHELFVEDDGAWRSFTHEPFDAKFQAIWEAAAPEELHGHAPSFLRKFTEPGAFQIWSGFFVKTAPGWSLQFRPLVNIHTVSAFSCYEGIVETDEFSPMPLFINAKIHRTNSEIYIDRQFPLFQICAIQRTTIGNQRSVQSDLATDAGDFPWEDFKKTIRVAGVTPERKTVGEYAARTRKRDRRE